MSGTVVPEKAQAEIPYALVEYTASFKHPIIEKLGVPAPILATILDALEPWGFTIDGVEVKTHAEKLAEYAMIFYRTHPATPRLSFAVRPNKAVFSAENPDWTEADQLIAGMNAGLDAISKAGGAEIQSHQVTIGMHIQLKTKPRKEITAPLLNQIAFKMLDGEVKFPGIILQRENSSIIIDASLAYANGLFVRIMREHPSVTTLQKIAEALRRDEEQLFDVLGLEGTL
jgi:hypothetical protein